MGLLDKISGWFAGGDAPAGAGPHFVVDGVALLNPRTNYRPTPREMISLLYRLGRFSEKEKVRITVIFDGEPLHKAADGDEFQGVTVYYADNAAGRPERFLGVLKQARGGRVFAVCPDGGLEKKAMEAGAQPLRTSTFRKAMETAGEGDERPPRPPPGGGRRRPQGPRRPAPQGAGSPGGGPGGPAGPPSEAPTSEKPAGGPSDTVRNLLDVVE